MILVRNMVKQVQNGRSILTVCVHIANFLVLPLQKFLFYIFKVLLMQSTFGNEAF